MGAHDASANNLVFADAKEKEAQAAQRGGLVPLILHWTLASNRGLRQHTRPYTVSDS